MPYPRIRKSYSSAVYSLLALLAAAYVAAEIVLPLVLAVVLKLLLQPAMRLLQRWHVPRAVASLMLLFSVFGIIFGLGLALAGPATAWPAKPPQSLPRLQEPAEFFAGRIDKLHRFFHQVRRSAPAGPAHPRPRSMRRRPHAYDEAFYRYTELYQRA